jgi:hypothetical protein
MMATQLELAPGRRREPRIAPDDPRIGQLIEFLRGRGWTKRHLAAEALGCNDRVLRALKANSGGLIISDSQRGYRLTLEADAGEVQHAVNEIASRVRELEQYRLDIERVWHARRAPEAA